MLYVVRALDTSIQHTATDGTQINIMQIGNIIMHVPCVSKCRRACVAFYDMCVSLNTRNFWVYRWTLKSIAYIFRHDVFSISGPGVYANSPAPVINVYIFASFRSNIHLKLYNFGHAMATKILALTRPFRSILWQTEYDRESKMPDSSRIVRIKIVFHCTKQSRAMRRIWN